MSCNGCLPNEREKQRLLKSKYEEAKKFAVDNKAMVVLYFDNEGYPQYMASDAAKHAGVQPVQYVSYL